MGCDANPWLLNPTIVAAIVALGSLIVRHLGVAAERTFRVAWGDFPTTIIMRWSDDKRSKEWKQRMRQLSKKKLGLKLPSEEDEKNDHEGANKLISDAFGKIRTRIWGNKGLPSHAANIDYGFARNLYGARWLWWSLAVLCLAVSILIPLALKQSLPVMNIAMLAILVVFVPIVEWKIVRPHVDHCAFRYAEHAWEYLERM